MRDIGTKFIDIAERIIQPGNHFIKRVHKVAQFLIYMLYFYPCV